MRRREAYRTWRAVAVPSRLREPRLQDFVTDDDVQRHGWPSGSLTPRQVREHPLVGAAQQRYRREVQRFRDQCAREHQVPDDLAWQRRVAVGNVVPLP